MVDWNIILQITVPILGGIFWIITRMDKGFKDVNDKINKIDSRLSRLEGKFDERGYWESRDEK